MKLRAIFSLTVCSSILLGASALAQTDAPGDDADALRHQECLFALFVGGGSGVGQRSNVQMFRAGVGVGRVMTGELGQGWAKGTFELDAEITPIDYVFWKGYRNVYGFGVTPVDMKWNFTRGKRVVPFVDAAGGVLWSASHVPRGDTSRINFTPGGGGGMHVFLKPGRALTWTLRAEHISNASLGNHNPGVNASLQGSVGYTWFKTR